MPQRDHSRVPPAAAQCRADQEWQELVKQRLPAEREAQARQRKAFVRARGVPIWFEASLQIKPLALWRGLLYYVLSHAS